MKTQMNAIDMTAALVVGGIASALDIPTEEAMVRFLQSHTAEMLYDPSLKMWCDGPAYLIAEYLHELGEVRQ